MFQHCFAGEGPTVCQDGCQRLDLDPDDDIDLADYAEFQSLIGNAGP